MTPPSSELSPSESEALTKFKLIFPTREQREATYQPPKRANPASFELFRELVLEMTGDELGDPEIAKHIQTIKKEMKQTLERYINAAKINFSIYKTPEVEKDISRHRKSLEEIQNF